MCPNKEPQRCHLNIPNLTSVLYLCTWARKYESKVMYKRNCKFHNPWDRAFLIYSYTEYA